MTWIRWESRAPQHELVGFIAEGLKVRRAEALGLYNAVCCNFAEYRRDGRVDQVTDTSLEQWAGWEGKKGRFAALFRERCVENRSGERDPAGTIKGWWRQQALLERQARDAARYRLQQKTRTKSGRSTREVRADSARNPHENAVSSGGHGSNTTLPVRERSLRAASPAESAGSGPEGPPPADVQTAPEAQEIQLRRERLKAGIRELQAEAARP